jgi:hypothetical protein
MGERPERVGLRGLRVDRRVYSFFKHAGVAQGFAMATAHGSTAPTSFALKQHHALGVADGDPLAGFVGDSWEVA